MTHSNNFKTKILVIDEIPENIQILSDDLRNDGYQVISATTAFNGIKLAKNESPDAILIDLMTPDIDGLETCRILHNDKLTTEIPIIIISAKEDRYEIIKGLDIGAVDYISKPFHYPIVAARVRSAVRIKKSQDKIRKINSELEDARNEAQLSEKIKSQFLANMSHEIRTSLTGVLGMSSLLIDTPLNEEQKIFVDTITSSGTLLMELINNILDYSKFESNKIILESTSFNLPQLLDHVFNIISHKLDEKTLHLVKSIDEDIATNLIGDPTRFRQVLLNLMSNAVKFSRQGDIIVNAKLITKVSNQYHIRIEVIDSGTGIEKEQLKLLFKPFSQADQSTTRLYGGTGLGLAICKETIELMNGQIGVISEPGIGSTFWFELNLQAAEENLNAANQSASSSETIEITNLLLNKTVLLVEDNKTNQLFANALLKPTAATIVIAENGKIALEKLAESDVDIILMDCQMAVMDGFEATKAIRNSTSIKKDTIIVAMTANAMSGDKEECLQAGMNDYLSKPFQKEEFYQVLNRWIVSN